MKKFIPFMALALLFAACKKETQTPAPAETDIPGQAAEDAGTAHSEYESNTGHVYTLSNETGGNQVLDYTRNADGSLSFAAGYATGGNGSGGGLGNQGAVTLVDWDKALLAVNAGSNTISSFKITGNGLKLRSTISSGGTRPVSITEHNGLVYVLNAGGDGNISGFRLQGSRLQRIPNSTRPLSSTASGPAQISFTNNGRVLVITEKATNKIITYTVNNNGTPGAFHSITSASPTPFGFAVGRFGRIFVSEAVGGAANASNVSSYRVGYDGSISLITGPVGTNQSAACWVVLTRNGRYAYTTNTASNTISSYRTGYYGSLSLLQSVAATSDMGPIDAALSSGSRYLYVLNNSSHSITGYSVQQDGSLTALPVTATGIVPGANGLAAD
jgi:6-phosphogluconolactonase